MLIKSGRLAICPNSAVEIMLRVDGIKGECKVIMSLTSNLHPESTTKVGY